MDKRKMNLLFPGVLFSILGLFAWLILANYARMDEHAMKTLFSPWAGLFTVILSNILGALTIRTSIWLNTKYLLNARKKRKLVLVYIVAMLVFLVVNYIFLVIAKLLSGTPDPFIFSNGGIRILTVIWIIEVVVLGLLLANRAMAHMFSYQQRVAKMQEENAIARYTALQDQLNPHFLFNSFNILVAEIESNPDRAVLFTRRLSDVYRYVLQVQNRKLVTLEEELTFTSAYLYLHEIRLGDCIRCDIDLSDEQNEYQLPPLTLQLLLENIIKHNAISTSQPMEVKIAVVDEWLVVSNTLCPRVSEESIGVGLKNLSNRCLMTLEKDIEIGQTRSSFTVKIPLLYE